MQPNWNEADRLKALRSYDVLDTPTETAFRDFVQVAAHVCEAPIAIVNFVDEQRQWFAAEQGLGVRETPLGRVDLRARDPAAWDLRCPRPFRGCAVRLQPAGHG